MRCTVPLFFGRGGPFPAKGAAPLRAARLFAGCRAGDIRETRRARAPAPRIFAGLRTARPGKLRAAAQKN